MTAGACRSNRILVDLNAKTIGHVVTPQPSYPAMPSSSLPRRGPGGWRTSSTAIVRLTKTRQLAVGESHRLNEVEYRPADRRIAVSHAVGDSRIDIGDG